eukprot:TRINITY_DN6469_c0_g1_i1.p1 TRINITY_DN6469_c0_g1~~TRINITY_DN6469_c0_g1_i1.p1  ORF type:complete len:872 (-),score=307.04 TRINITY_DN6469_c0_g1_i1:21-2528(-)
MTTEIDSLRRELVDIVSDLRLNATVTDDELDQMAKELLAESDGDLSSVGGSPPSLLQEPSHPSTMAHFQSGKEVAELVSMLRLELKEKSAQISMLRKEREIKEIELQETIHALKHEKEVQAIEYEAERKKMKAYYTDVERKLQQQIETVRKKQDEIEKTTPALREKMENWREQLRVLIVSETTYAEIKSVPVEQRTLREYVQSKVFELVDGMKQDMESIRKESEMYKENLDRTTRQLDRARHDIEIREQEHKESLRDLQSQLETYREKSERLTQEITTSTRSVREGQSKGEMFDRVKSDFDELQSQFLSLQRNYDALSAAHALLQEQKKSGDASTSQQQHELEILRMDKVYLTKECERQTRDVEEKKSRLSRVERELESAKQAKEDLFEKYMRTRTDLREEFEKEMQQEISRIQQETSRELETIRVNAKEVSEREQQSLRDARDHARRELEKAEERVAEIRDKNDSLHSEYRLLKSTMDGQISELRSNLSVKSFELERSSLALDEAKETLASLRHDYEKIQKKFDVLKEEYYSLQSSTGTRISELEISLKAKEERIEQYERMEEEVDDFVRIQGGSERADGGGDLAMHSIPTSARRRLQQGIDLARKAARMESDLSNASKDRDKLQQEKSDLEAKLRHAEDLLKRTHQPYSYLLEVIELRDAELEKGRIARADVEEKLGDRERELTELQHKYEDLQRDMERLLEQRGTIGKLREALLRSGREDFDRSQVHALSHLDESAIETEEHHGDHASRIDAPPSPIPAVIPEHVSKMTASHLSARPSGRESHIHIVDEPGMSYRLDDPSSHMRPTLEDHNYADGDTDGELSDAPEPLCFRR